MIDCIIKWVRFSGVQVVVAAVLLMTGARTGYAWTSADLFNVDVSINVSSDAVATVTTDARFVVEAGHFHGFDLVDMPGGELDKAASFAFRDDGRRYNLKFRRVRGRTRVVLADDEEVKRGGITFQLIHRVDLAAEGALRRYQGRARLDWTPLIWDEGLDNMTVYLQLPKQADGHIEVDPAVTDDYIVEVGAHHANFIKYRPVRWYPMKLVVDFNPILIPGLAAETAEVVSDDEQAPLAAASMARPGGPPAHFAFFPSAVVLIAFGLLVLKFRHVRSAYRHIGMTARPCLLHRTSLLLRSGLALTAVLVGLWVQHMGHLAAGIPAMTVAAALFILRKGETSLALRPGGAWRQMTEEDVTGYHRRASQYRRGRISFIDLTTFRGAVAFALFLGGLGIGAYTAAAVDPDLAWTAVIDGLILAIPAWFGSIRAELPVDTTLEGFYILRKWRKSLSKLFGARASGGDPVEFWVREDETGPIEVRLRTSVAVEGLNNLEVAGETVRAGSTYRTKTVFVFRLEPGTPTARKLAKSPHAAEHHLTPDLEEEIIVLRNRRGRSTSGLSPLRTALSMIGA